ncbi:unnamed protein product [Parnassius apollo]|uniref:(apollo) hypothetical protein n=1 Tax=Parnassius apollo TaxID=110799 RepID=A0A8S3XQN6_PARAO|nr:unnamed protein product [Parnassius apollo]
MCCKELVHVQERDAYGNEVGVAARRVPVAYLLVDVPVGVARRADNDLAPAPVAPAAPPPHSMRALHHHIQSATSFLEAMSDLHVLLYLCSNEALPLSLDTVQPLLQAVRERDAAAADSWRLQTQPATLLQLARAAAEADAPHGADAGGSVDGAGGAGGAGAVWTCALCTYHNAAALRACEMCAMPRSDAM